jgi:thioredoxin 1
MLYTAHIFHSMPTFMIFRGGKPINTIKGADPRALTSAVEAAVKSAPASKPLYSTPGRTLGGPGIKPAQSLNRPASASLQEFFSAIIAFFGLYFVTLFSVRIVGISIYDLLI